MSRSTGNYLLAFLVGVGLVAGCAAESSDEGSVTEGKPVIRMEGGGKHRYVAVEDSPVDE